MMSHPVSVGPLALPGALAMPPGATGLVLFAHGSGSGRASLRNRAVANALQRWRFGTLLFDMLTEAEARQRENFFDIALLAQRLLQALDWSHAGAAMPGLPFGFFGAGVGAAAALVASAERPGAVAALVARGGRPDLAGPALSDVRTPTLLIVGSADAEVLHLNRAAYARLTCEKQFEIVPRATHLFAEAGALETVARLARDWFGAHFGNPGAQGA